MHGEDWEKKKKAVHTTLRNAYLLGTKGLETIRRGDRREMVRDWERKWEIMDTLRGVGFIKEELVNSSKCWNFWSWRREGFERSIGINVDKSHYWQIPLVE